MLLDLNHMTCTLPVDELIQFTAVLWLREFLTLSGRAMIPYCANILSAVLPCVSYEHCKFSILSLKRE